VIRSKSAVTSDSVYYLNNTPTSRQQLHTTHGDPGGLHRDDDGDDDDDEVAIVSPTKKRKSASSSSPSAETSWLPGIVRANWKEMTTNRRMTTIYFQLLSGTPPDGLKLAVTDDGLHLEIKSLVPSIMIEDQLNKLHAQESARDLNYYRRVNALHDAVQEMKKLWGTATENEYWVCRFPLDFPCEKQFHQTKRIKDKDGLTRIYYLTLQEKGEYGAKTGDEDWTIFEA